MPLTVDSKRALLRRYFPYAMLLIALAIFLRLGFWQIDRFDEKTTVVAELAAAKSAEPKRLEGPLPTDAEPLGYRRLIVVGQWHPQHTFLWDNRVREQRVGYQVITPFQRRNGQWLLVDRGWLPGNPDRSVLPEVITPEGEYKLTGVLRRLPEVAMQLSEQPEAGWPRRVQTLRPDVVSAAFAEPLPNLLMWLDHDNAANQRAGIYAPLQSAVSMPPERHLGYAVQWFALSVTALIFLLLIIKRRTQASRRRNKPGS